MREMPFSSINLGTLQLPNRFVMAAAADNLATDTGHISPAQVQRLGDYARGNIGLIISGGLGISQGAKSRASAPSLGGDSHIAGHRELVSRVHENGGRIAAQLVHSGLWTYPYQNQQGSPALTPSPPPKEGAYRERLGQVDPLCQPAGEEDIAQIMAEFSQAARRAQEAGYDALELHAAHDSLFAQFLSPYTNTRDDAWGGGLEGRCRLHLEAVRAIKQVVGQELPLIVKLGIADGFGGGLEAKEGVAAARLLAGSGIDSLEVSLGLLGRGDWDQTCMRIGINKPEKEAYYRSWAKEIKSQVEVPVILTGGVRSLGVAGQVLTQGEADMLGLCRPLIMEPHLIKQWQEGGEPLAGCISCNKCVLAVAKGEPLACQVKDKIAAHRESSPGQGQPPLVHH